MRADQVITTFALRRAHRTAMALTVAGACFLLLTLAGIVQARDDAGVHDFFAAESRRSAGPSAHSAPASAVNPFSAPRTARQPSSGFRSSVRAPKTTYANLPRSEPSLRKRRIKPMVVEDASDPTRPTRSKADIGDPVSALLRDETLQAGDIVVLPDGPKVFKGDGGTPHKWSSFEDVRRSRHVSKGHRKMVLALTKPVSSPGQEPGRYLPVREVAETTADQYEARAVRIVYPSASP